MRSSTLICILLLGSRFCYAGLPDSIIALPVLPSLITAHHTQQQFEQHDYCSLPGTIPGFSDSQPCFNPLQQYIDDYSTNYDSQSNTNDDSITLRNYLIAIATYQKFHHLENRTLPLPAFSHDEFIRYLETPEKIREKPFLLAVLDRIGTWVFSHVLQPLVALFNRAFASTSFARTTILTLLGASLFVIVAFVLILLIRRFYPRIGSSAKLRQPTDYSLSPQPNWLSEAQNAATAEMFSEAITHIYRYSIEWFGQHHRIRRHEWWTNRQFLHLVKKRFGNDYPAAEQIVSSYERVVFGHLPADFEQVRSLLEQAALLTGKRS